VLDPVLIAELRWITGLAIAGGADPDRVQALSAALVDLVLDRMDPRRQRSLELAQRIAAAKALGVPMAALAARFGRSKSRIHRLLKAHDFTRQVSVEMAPSQVAGGKRNA
jgi:hypothetical protein